MDKLPDLLNHASATATEWLGRLDWHTWALAAVLLLLFPHLIREIIGLAIAVVIAVFVAAFVMSAAHAETGQQTDPRPDCIVLAPGNVHYCLQFRDDMTAEQIEQWRFAQAEEILRNFDFYMSGGATPKNEERK